MVAVMYHGNQGYTSCYYCEQSCYEWWDGFELHKFFMTTLSKIIQKLIRGLSMGCPSALLGWTPSHFHFGLAMRPWL